MPNLKSLFIFDQICNSRGDCCNTGKLDNPFHNDFNGKNISKVLHFIAAIILLNSIGDIKFTYLNEFIFMVFSEGGTDEFTDQKILSQCYRFDLHSDLAIKMTLNHEGA